LDSCIFLGANSSYSALEDDQVYLEEENEVPHSSSSRESTNDVPSPNIVADRSTEFIIELQVSFASFPLSLSLSLSRFFYLIRN
jgi:vacuolar protein sorting-associated protein 13A/C